MRSPNQWKDARRFQAWQLKQQGWPQRQITAALGISEAAVSPWMTRARPEGAEALRRRPSPGAPRRLPDAQMTRPPHTAPRPRSLRLPGALETRGRIAAGQRLHLERLSAYAPELNPGEGLWAQLKDVERRHLCGFNLTHLPQERCDAVKRVRRTPRLVKSFFQGAKL
jgi:hypothetical protein